MNAIRNKLFYFEMAIKITGSKQNYRVGRVSGNTPIFRPYTKKTYGQPYEKLFPTRWPLRNLDRT